MFYYIEGIQNADLANRLKVSLDFCDLLIAIVLLRLIYLVRIPALAPKLKKKTPSNFLTHFWNTLGSKCDIL